MPRASAAAAASSRNVGRNAGHSGPSSAYQSFRPVTRSMTRGSDPIVASPGFKADPGFKAGGSASTSTQRRTSDASFSTQLAASRPTATHARTPLKVTLSGWKPLTQPVALNEERKCAGLTINPTAKRSRVASSRAVKDSINHLASKANSNIPSGKKYRDEEIVSLGDQSDGAVMPSPTKKLQICKGHSDAPSIRKSTIQILGVKGEISKSDSVNQLAATVATLPKPILQNGYNKKPSNVPIATLPKPILQNDYNKKPSNVPIATLPKPILQNDYNKKPSNVPIATLPKPILQNDYNKKPSSVPIMANQASGLAGPTVPLITPKLEIGNMKDSNNPLSNSAYTRALLIKQQEQLLQQFKLGSSQQQLYIKGPALFENDDPPPVEPLGTRCQLCKLDVAFRPQGDPGRDANAPPVVAVLACYHVFHSKCIESVYGLAEPLECLACLEHGAAH